ncbi:unnamed protein product [Spodoptera exigua]|nr:unnamed protein product [Spodoptera exigua]
MYAIFYKYIIKSAIFQRYFSKDGSRLAQGLYISFESHEPYSFILLSYHLQCYTIIDLKTAEGDVYKITNNNNYKLNIYVFYIKIIVT